MKKKIVLASSSKRRLDILNNNGINPIVLPTYSDESIPNEAKNAEEVVQILSMRKALACKKDISLRETLIIAADTVVVSKENNDVKKFGIFGKPKSLEEARFMIKSIEGRSHEVITGCTLIADCSMGEKTLNFFEKTIVYCKPISEEEIEEYIKTDESYDKAGGYGIQGRFGRYVEKIEGDYDNVVGLPFNRIVMELEENGLSDFLKYNRNYGG